MNLEERAREAATAARRLTEGMKAPDLDTRIDSSRRRRRLLVGTTVTALILSVGVSIPLAVDAGRDDLVQVRTDRPGDPRETTPSGVVDGRFVPPTTREGDVVVMPVTLLDGRRYELRYPAELEIAQGGFVSGASVSTAVRRAPQACCDRQVEATYTTAEAAYPGSRPTATYLTSDGQRAGYYPSLADAEAPAAPVGALVFQFGPWMVKVQDRNPDDAVDAMSVSERQRLARQLQGSIDPDGFLVLHFGSPLKLQPSKREFALGDAREGLNSVSIGPRRLCNEEGSDTSRRRHYTPSSPVDDALAWCDPVTGLHVNIEGSRSFVETAGRDLKIRALDKSHAGERFVLCPKSIRVDATTGPDGLPPAGPLIEDLAHAEAVLRDNAALIERDYPKATSLEIGPGGGYAWVQAPDGSVTVRQVADYAIQIRLKGRRDCPPPGRSYSFYDGIPLFFLASA